MANDLSTRTNTKGYDTMIMRSRKNHRFPALLMKVVAPAFAAILLIAPAPSGAVDLLHNSADTGSAKWQAQGGWGVEGGKYGKFTCSTCHQPNRKPNIKNVRSTIATMNGENWPNGAPTVSVSFTNVTSMGDDRGGHSSSSRICEACHSQNRFHNFNTSSNTGGLNHPNPQAVCTSCHKHNTGFKAACGGCHGNPPTEAVLGGDTGLVGTPRPSNAMEPGRVGAHVTHTETRAMVCDTCHYINNGGIKMPNLSNTIDIGFFGFGGKVTSGTYVPYTSFSRGYRIASGTGNTVIAAGASVYADSNLCLNVYCHGGGSVANGKPPLTGGSNNTPRWDASSQNACGSCHGTTAANPPTTAGHRMHAGSSGYSFACDTCHPAIDVTHVQGSVRWAFNTADQRVGAGALYQPAGAPEAAVSGATGDLAPSSSFGRCSSLYCHSDGAGGAAYVPTPTWGGTLPDNCIGCHGNSATSANPIATKGHKAHVNNTSTRFGNFNFRCNECHNNVVDASDVALIGRQLHVNRAADVAWGPKSTGGGEYASAGCSQIYCHSNGQGVYKAPPTIWSAIADGQQGTIPCDYCHGGLAGSSAPVSSQRHANHIGAGPLPHRPAPCNWCHSNTVAADGVSVYNGTDVRHINRTLDVSFFKMGNFSGGWTKSTNRCSSTYCHASTSQVWTTTSLNSCGSCHEANNTTTAGAKLSDAHRKHYNRTTRPSNTSEEGWMNTNLSSTSNVFMCGTCHPANPTEKHINGPASPNGTAAELVLRLPFIPPTGAERPETVTRGTSPIQADGRGYLYSTGTTCDTYCHSDGRGGSPNNLMRWSVSTTSCGNCHNQAGDANPTWSGSHSRHVTVGITLSVTCNACHAATASGNNTLIAGRRDRHPNGFRNVTGNSIAGPFTWNSTSQQCSNVYCHRSNVVTWGGPPLPADCSGCHGNNASSETPVASYGHTAHVNNTSTRFGGFNFRCQECHNTTVDSSDRSVISSSVHMNRTNDVSWGPKSTGGGTYSTAGCTQIYCHSNGQGVYKAPPTAWNAIAEGQQGTIQCDYCHGGLAGSITPVSSQRHANHIGSGPLPHRPTPCNWCHSNTVAEDGASVFSGPAVQHINRTLDVAFIKMGNFSGTWTKASNRCSSTYCHASVNQTWTTTTLNTCGSCHEANNSTTSTAKLSDAHRKHYNRTTRPSNSTEEGWTNTNLSSTNNVFMCGTCHPANPTESHINGPAAANGSAAQLVLRLPFAPPSGAGRPEQVIRGTGGVQRDGRGYLYSTGTTCDTYCHSDGRGGPPKTAMAWAVSTTSCGNCHSQASDNTAGTTWSAPHNKHSNTYGNGGTVGSNNTTTNNTFVTCAACHASTASSNTALLTGSRARHPNGFRNISASSAVGSAAFKWNPGTNSCKNGYCHSRAYSFTDYSTPWIRWDLTQNVTCGSCHSSYPIGPDYSNGYKGKANSHPKHAQVWGFTCDWCHNQTTTTGNTITNVRNHVNKNYNVAANSTKIFLGKANTFTATATTNPPTVKTTCTNVSCHGGSATRVYTWGGTNKCGDCHFATTDTVDYQFRNNVMALISRTEWRYSGHGKPSGSYDVTGAPFAGFSSAAATAGAGGDPCLYCHEYDAVPHGSTSNPLRLRNFSNPTWGRNGVCLVCHASTGATGVTPGAGYTTKTAVRKVNKFHFGGKHSATLNGGQLCWDCHDAHGDRATGTDGRPIAMVQKKPARESNATTGTPTFFTATTVRFVAKAAGSDWARSTAPFNGICNVCHTYKASDPNKMVHFTATASDGHNSSTLCTTCHQHSPDTAYDGKAYRGSGGPCDSCHGGNNNGNLSAGTTAGHAIHYNLATVFTNLTGSNRTVGSTYGFACKNCHPVNLHDEGDGSADLLPAVAYSPGITTATDGKGFTYTVGGTCGTNSCHHDGRGGAPAVSVTWTSGKSANTCGNCHGNPPTSGPSAGTHADYVSQPTTSCSQCHSHFNADGTVNNAQLHANGVINGGCVDCHAKPITRTKGRPGTTIGNVVGEFGLAWGHKKAGRGAITDADCIVCHLEGEYATGKASTTYHKDGNIDLRDPDGAGETPVTDISGQNWVFQRFSTSFASGTRSSTGHTANSIDNIITQKFCLACHDSNGATNPTARTVNGTQYMPFGGVSLGGNYTVANGSAALNGLVNVKAQFATTNSSAHPVLGPRNRDYPTAARLNIPYKPTGARGTSGTLSQGVVINCFDCHNTTGDPLTLRTVSAHGRSITVRGIATIPNAGTAPSASNDVTLCKVCHAGYVTGTSSHGTGSAVGSSTNSGMTSYMNYGCTMCHSSGYSTAVVRPVRAMDVHGANALPSGGLTKSARWAGSSTGTPATVNARPYAFIRNTQVLSDHSPKKAGSTTYSPNCNMASGSPVNCSQGSKTYSVGGTF